MDSYISHVPSSSPPTFLAPYPNPPSVHSAQNHVTEFHDRQNDYFSLVCLDHVFKQLATFGKGIQQYASESHTWKYIRRKFVIQSLVRPSQPYTKFIFVLNPFFCFFGLQLYKLVIITPWDCGGGGRGGWEGSVQNVSYLVIVPTEVVPHTS